jgi:hypothetical protein
MTLKIGTGSGINHSESSINQSGSATLLKASPSKHGKQSTQSRWKVISIDKVLPLAVTDSIDRLNFTTLPIVWLRLYSTGITQSFLRRKKPSVFWILRPKASFNSNYSTHDVKKIIIELETFRDSQSFTWFYSIGSKSPVKAKSYFNADAMSLPLPLNWWKASW